MLCGLVTATVMLPVFVLLGFTTTVYVSGVVSVYVFRLKPPSLLEFAVCSVPFGLSNLTSALYTAIERPGAVTLPDDLLASAPAA